MWSKTKRGDTMTTAELHLILDDENKKLSIEELKEVLYQLQQDSFNEAIKIFLSTEKDKERKQYYYGEENAFCLALMLLEHLETNK